LKRRDIERKKEKEGEKREEEKKEGRWRRGETARLLTFVPCKLLESSCCRVCAQRTWAEEVGEVRYGTR
jgi:hypothetical protein